MFVRELDREKSIVARFDYGADLVESITDLAEKMEIRTGIFSAIGALQKAEIGYYDQETYEYHGNLIDAPMELVSCSGNISIRDEKPFVHAHASLADRNGKVLGGHLQSGVIFAAEVYIQELKGEVLVRSHDPVTDLYLWGGAD